MLRLDVLERCRYTVLLRLSHLFADGESPPSAPEALVRLYLDARLSELVGLAGAEADGAVPGAVERKLRLNCFFGKWLQFLEDRGHSPQTLEAWLSAPGLAHGRLVACG
ncbi:MAG: DUF1249 domain-containing protein [Xanthomonadales bacterium]|nr:DUF1249 domain-containing protein [Xanthomonadales bacterium]